MIPDESKSLGGGRGDIKAEKVRPRGRSARSGVRDLQPSKDRSPTPPHSPDDWTDWEDYKGEAKGDFVFRTGNKPSGSRRGTRGGGSFGFHGQHNASIGGFISGEELKK